MFMLSDFELLFGVRRLPGSFQKKYWTGSVLAMVDTESCHHSRCFLSAFLSLEQRAEGCQVYIDNIELCLLNVKEPSFSFGLLESTFGFDLYI